MKSIVWYFFISLLLLISSPIELYAQIDLRIKTVPDLMSEDDLWNFNITNVGPQSVLLDFTVTVYDDEENTLYQAKYEGFQVEPSIPYTVSRAILGQIKVEQRINNKTQEANSAYTFLEPGSYSHCVSVSIHHSDIEIGRDCVMAIVKPLSNDSLKVNNSNRGKLEKYVPHGSLELFNYTDYKPKAGEATFINRNSGFHFAPQLNMLGIPVNGSFYYDTDTGYYYSTSPQINLQLDVYSFQEILEQRLLDYVNGKVNLPASEYDKYVALIKEHEQIQEIIQNPAFEESLIPIDQEAVTEALELKLSKKTEELAGLSSYTDSVKMNMAQCESLDTLSCQELRKQYENLQDTKDTVEKRIEEMRMAIEKAKGYLKLIERKDELETMLLEDSTLSLVKEHYDKLKDFDADALTDPNQIVSKLKESGKISGIETLFSNFKQLQIGASVPECSEFSVSGVMLNGLHTEYELNSSSITLIGGKVRTNSFFYNPTAPLEEYSKLYAGGYTKKISPESTYSIYVVHADFPLNDSIAVTHSLEKNNALVSRMEYSFAEEKIKAEFEGALSFAKYDDVLTTSEPSIPNSPFSWLYQTLLQKDDPENNSFTDLAAKFGIEAVLFEGKTTLHSSARYVGTGFYTPGNPYLINDRFSTEIGMDQSLLKNRIRGSLAVIRNEDNLSGTKSATTVFFSTRTSLTLNFPKTPMLTILYQPNVILNDYDQIQVNTLSVTSSYRYFLKKQPCSIMLAVTDMKSLSAIEASVPFRFRYVSASHIIFLKGLQLQTGYQHNTSVSDSMHLKYDLITIGFGFRLFKVVDLNAGVDLSKIDEGNFQPGGHMDISSSISKNLTIRASIYSFPTDPMALSYQYEYRPKASAYFTTTINF